MRSVSVPRAVTMMIGVSPLRRSARATSRPSPSGRFRSSSTRSGSTRSAISIALATVVATTGSNPSRASAFENGSKIDGSSSTNKIRGPVTRATVACAPMGESRAVLITGCSSGIGHATAERLADNGWTVYATARNADKLSELADKGCKTLSLDVEDEDSMKAAVAEVEQAEGAVGVLINNAGYSQSGAVESVPMDKVRKQFETNVFGLVRMTQLVLPGMRKQGWGRVVNISSMGGKLVFPGGGYYHATKYAVEAISDALRYEVKGFGIDVVLIEPGLIVTNFGGTAAGSIGNGSDEDGSDAYEKFNKAVGDATAGIYEGPAAKLGGPPEAVAKVIDKALSSKRPKPRYTVTPSAKLLMTQRRLMSDRMWDRMMRTQFPRPGA
jgi:NAD(P)-dependent dehydrogenase (short-subunit alcohol dehydrogenase family)